ncbi:histone lysine demethylase PHF8-like isoform X2 [Venturia canescens]|uniref:histone lysine demethylase PHF8-like isoform X2 n=1 Tax=Venturia canescens TaxID=32260 RepID=UPI001C9C9C0F|nr:histone lysine demethylase PHF8-like isoform X2 [Venturia canescens]
MDLQVNYCFCGITYDTEQFMIQCDVCKKWYHGGCVAVKEYMSTDLDKYHCPECETTCGPSIMKVQRNWHRHEYAEPDADGKPVQTGTAVFVRELKSRNFPKADDVVKHVRGQQLTLEYLQNNGFETPIIIDGKDGLDMVVPPPNFSVYDVESYIGGDREMDVIDVTRQSDLRMKLRDFVEYYNDPCRTRVFNVISLEFTNTGLSPMIEAPYIARKLDWVNSVWPRDWPEDSELKLPEVQKYCLMGVKDSFTDFHIDFGGTSVWYHVLHGEKIFYLIKPTPANLQLYQQWMCSAAQSETFFGDQVDACYKCTIKQGQTMMIPTGWIHAVLTPIDSLVFGGNFLHGLNIPMQIQIYELEKKIKTPKKFQYPGFETVNWFAAKKLLKELRELNEEEKKCPAYFLQGIKALLAILKQWNTDKDYNMISRSQIPETVNSQKLLKDMSKEIRHAERYLISLNPPKPERESKRKKKRPINKDFVNYDVVDRMAANTFSTNLKSTASKKAEPTNQEKPQIRPPLKITLPKPPPVPKNNSTRVQKKSTGIMKKKRSLKQGKQSPTVIRFKLGDKEVVRSTNDDVNIHSNFAIDQRVPTTKELTWKQTSVYDFHDGSNESDYDGFTIDENPKRKKSTKTPGNKKVKKIIQAGVDVLSEAPKNGIEELLKASAYALPAGTQRLEVPASATNPTPGQTVPAPPIGSGRASPSTREAIAGMLSFSAQCYSTTSESPEKSTKSSKSGHEEDEDDQSIENIDKVHQDEDFIYPTLDASDDEEYIFKPRGKRRVDEAWNPKARVGPLLPKTNRPAREGVKKTSVEKGLEAAAAKRAKQADDFSEQNVKKESKKRATAAKRTYKKQKKEIPVIVEPPPPPPPLPVEELAKPLIGYGSILTSPNRLKDVKAKLAAPIPVERKPRKGMKTAKQRLGKILKLHKMMH